MFQVLNGDLGLYPDKLRRNRINLSLDPFELLLWDAGLAVFQDGINQRIRSGDENSYSIAIISS